MPVYREEGLRYLPPEIAALLDAKTLEISKNTFVDEKLKESLSDLLYHVALKGKGTVFVYLLASIPGGGPPVCSLREQSH